MADRPQSPDTDVDTRVESDHKASVGTSRWQKVVGTIGLLVLLLIGNQIAGQLGGGVGPGGIDHGPTGNAPATEVQQQNTDGGGGHTRPDGRGDH